MVPTLAWGDTYLDGRYLPWLRGTYLGRGYLPWTGGTYLGLGEGSLPWPGAWVSTLDVGGVHTYASVITIVRTSYAGGEDTTLLI